MLHEEALTEQIIGALIDVHRALGPGLLESAYQACLARELSLRELPFEQEKPLPVEYKGVIAGLRISAGLHRCGEGDH